MLVLSPMPDMAEICFLLFENLDKRYLFNHIQTRQTSSIRYESDRSRQYTSIYEGYLPDVICFRYFLRVKKSRMGDNIGTNRTENGIRLFSIIFVLGF